MLHGLSESFLNLGIVLRQTRASSRVARAGQAFDRIRHAPGWHGAPMIVNSPPTWLGSYTQAANGAWQTGSREQAISISADGITYIRKLSAENPDLTSYRGLLANMLADEWSVFSRFLVGPPKPFRSAGRRRRLSRPAQPPTTSSLANAAFSRVRLAALLEPGFATKEFKSWNEDARHQADLAVADLRAASAKGFQGHAATSFATIRAGSRSWNARTSSPSWPRWSGQPKSRQPPRSRPPAIDSPLDRPGRLEDDRFLGELTIGLIDAIAAASDESRLEALLVQVEARRKAGNGSPMLRAGSAIHSIEDRRRALESRRSGRGQAALGSRRWLRFAPCPRMTRPVRPLLAQTATALGRITDRFAERGLWEHAEQYDRLRRAANPDGRSFHCFDSGLFALRRGDVLAYRAIADEALRVFRRARPFLDVQCLANRNAQPRRTGSA